MTAPTPLGLRTVIYHVPDLSRAKAFYSAAFGVAPYFDEPFYVGFEIGGFELGLDPDASRVSASAGGTEAYWGVADLDASIAHFVAHGATVVSPANGVGEGIRVAMLGDPFGNTIGLIENTHFRIDRVR